MVLRPGDATSDAKVSLFFQAFNVLCYIQSYKCRSAVTYITVYCENVKLLGKQFCLSHTGSNTDNLENHFGRP